MTVDEYIQQQSPSQQQILCWLRGILLTSSDELRETVRWRIPFYMFRGSHVCYLNVLRQEASAIDLAFLDGYQLPDEAGLLQERDRRMVKSIVVRDLTEHDEDVLRTYIQEALLLRENRRL